MLYSVHTKTPHRLVHKTVYTFKNFDDDLWIEHEGKRLEIASFQQFSDKTAVKDSKEIEKFINQKPPFTIVERRRLEIKVPH